MKKDLLSLSDLTPKEIATLLRRAAFHKKQRKRIGPKAGMSILRGKSLGMIFEKASTRTRVSFELAMYELGGHAVCLDGSSSQLNRGETYADTARVLGRYVHGIMIRTYLQKNLEELAKASEVPVINGLSDLHHPCQVLTDLFTVQSHQKDLAKLKIAYVGDGNNMANSWIEAAHLLKFSLFIATPKGYEAPAEIVKRFGATVRFSHDPTEAVRGADVVNTDTWFSMGQKVEDEKRQAFKPFQVNRVLMGLAKKDAIFLHCLPAHRGEEVTDGVLDGPQSVVWEQAENRLHVQKAILEMLLK